MKLSAIAFFVLLILIGVLSAFPLMSVHTATANWDPKQVKLVGSVVASAVFGLFSMIIIIFKKDEADKKWAYGMLGTIMGFWLPSPIQ